MGNWLEQIPTELRATRPKPLLHLSTVYVRKGKNDEAIRLLNDIIEVFRKEEEHILEAQALTRRSVALRYKGAHQMAVRDARQALSLAQDHGIPIDEADARSSLGTAYARQGKFPRAEREFKLSLESYQEHGSLFQLTDIHSRIALVYVYIGDSAKAITHFEQARRDGRRSTTKVRLASPLAIWLTSIASRAAMRMQSRWPLRPFLWPRPPIA